MDSVVVTSWCCGGLAGRLGRLGRRVYQGRYGHSNVNLMLCCELPLLRTQKQPRRQHAISHILIPLLLEFRCRQPLPICCARQGSVLQNDPTLWLCREDQSGLGQLGARRVPTETQQSSPPSVEYSDPDSTSNRRLGRCAAGISAILHGSPS
jgi:hypothetical protein